MINVTLKDGVVREYEEGASLITVAKSLGAGLYKAACLGKIDGEICDLRTVLTGDCEVEILTFDDEEAKKTFWHTCSHILAQAVKRLYPEVKLAIGPAVDNGFYYDFDSEVNFTPEILEKIEGEMKKIVKEGLFLEKVEMEPAEALALMEEKGEIYKVELIREHADKGEPISFYRQGEFLELCAGPHIPDTSRVKAFKLTSCTGAYWRGDSKNKMLQRIYGTAFTKAADLEEHLARIEEAKKRDHNKLGRELEIFTTVDYIGQGLPILLPKGTHIVQTLQRFVEDEEKKRGWVRTKTPLMAKSDLYKISGHWDHYKDNMYSTAYTKQIHVKMKDPNSTFLYPNQFCSYNRRTKAVKTGDELVDGVTDTIEKVEAIYKYTVDNISYDYQKAKTVQSGYLPNVDDTLRTKKGICFDYAALMTTMLRTQNIPTKLVIGFAGSVYHAWISVYTEEQGWIDNAIHFDGESWKFMDPTFASNGKDDPKINDYINNPTNYIAKFSY